SALGAPIGVALVGLVLFVILTLIFGRLFCGYLCPIGAVQELLYLLPTPKKRITLKKDFIIFRILFFIGLSVAALFFSVNILSYFGITAFFNLNFRSLFVFVFIGMLMAIILLFFALLMLLPGYQLHGILHCLLPLIYSRLIPEMFL
ncbi:MAG: 4Fe-4S binding protein, partial [Bacteroidales bacterium]